MLKHALRNLVLITYILTVTPLKTAHLVPPSSQTSLISDDIIVMCPREIFMTDNINIGSSSPTNAPLKFAFHAVQTRCRVPGFVRLPPHVFQIANSAYYQELFQVRRKCPTASFDAHPPIDSGETDSGKS